MLGRRILRVKAFKVLYGYAVTGKMTISEAMDELDHSCEATRDLYLFMLAIVIPLTAQARERIESARRKFHPSEEDLNPNTKFADNALAAMLASDPDFTKMIARKGLSWQPYDMLISSVLDSVRTKPYYKRYMESEERSLRQDCKLFTDIFEEEFSDNAQLDGILEDKSIYWTGDLEYALGCCCRTLKDIASGEEWRLPPLYQSDLILMKNPSAALGSDSAYVHKLLKSALTGYEDYFRRITEAVRGWEADRLNCADISLIVLGLAEAESFPDIPLKVTINEYVEISKYFSLPKSSSFVNGLLDKLIGALIAEGRISRGQEAER